MSKKNAKSFDIEGVLFNMHPLSPGTFWMGSPAKEKERNANEVLHKVTLTLPFLMGEMPVTQELFEAVMGANPSEAKGAKKPVTNVNWEDCQDCCRNLSRLTQIDFRLPSEAEWEYACRAGTTTVFSYGNDLDSSMANFNGAHPYGAGAVGPFLSATSVVGAYAPNPWGLYDMHGNVWEWCEDWHGQVQTRAATDPLGPHSGSDRVFRGGRWDGGASGCRAANRDYSHPSYQVHDLGFRLAATA